MPEVVSGTWEKDSGWQATGIHVVKSKAAASQYAFNLKGSFLGGFDWTGASMSMLQS